MATTTEMFSSSSNNLISNNPFVTIARKHASSLSRKIHHAFSIAVDSIEEIKPVFTAAVNSIRATVDKLATKKSEQGFPYAIEGFTHGAENLLLKMRRKLWRSSHNTLTA